MRGVTASLGIREDRRLPVGVPRTLAVPVGEAGTTGGPGMADVGYAVLLLGGFALLVATLRGLAQL